MPLAHILFLVLINFIWGSAPVVIKFGLGSMSPQLLMTCRFLLASLILLPITRWHTGQMVRVALVALSAGAAGFAILAAGLARAGDMGSVAVANQLNAPFATLLSIILLGEVVRWRRWLGLVLALGGGLIVAFDPAIAAHLDAFALVTLAAFVNAVSTIFMRELRGIHPWQMQAWLAHLSWPVLLILSLCTEHGQLAAVSAPNPNVVLAIVYLTLGSSFIAHAGFYAMVQRYEVSKIAPFLLLSPLATVLSGMIFMGDHITLRFVIGGAITLLGVTIITLRDKHLAEEKLA
jgi:O-acetylserine/cysteine efflux transporter